MIRKWNFSDTPLEEVIRTTYHQMQANRREAQQHQLAMLVLTGTTVESREDAIRQQVHLERQIHDWAWQDGAAFARQQILRNLLRLRRDERL